jgi:hypothetical protein
MSRRVPRLVRVAAVCAGVLCAASGQARAQADAVLPRGESDALIDAGRWSDAEEVLYGEVRMQPRDAIARARLGRYLAMKGALLPGIVLIEEAQQFGLPASTARRLIAPLRSLLDLRRRESAGARDSSIVVRGPSGAGALLRFPVVRASRRDTVWADLVPRMIGLDSASGASPRVGIEVVEWMVPAYDAGSRVLRLHAEPRSALRATGRRYPVLRSPTDVRVLVAPGRVRPLTDALAELNARWWQLDLVHGVLVVR